MSYLSLKNVTKRYPNGFLAVKQVNLEIEKGAFVVLLGPSGCGKTTTLRMIAGLEAVSSGEIHLDGRRIDTRTPADRDIAFVFQFFALYPHLNVRDNLAFPLRAQKMPQERIATLIEQTANMLGISELLLRKPATLSGGDQQRVSLARAMVRSPKAFLMDEPLGQCDLHRRESLRDEIKKLHLRTQATTVYVTHDQAEALSLADVVVLMNDGEIQQAASPQEIYHRPANLFAAHFIGSPGMALLTGTIESIEPLKLSGILPGKLLPVPATSSTLSIQQQVVLGVRPENIEVLPADTAEPPPGFASGYIRFREHLGAYDLLDLAVDERAGEATGNRVLKARTAPQRFVQAEQVYFAIKPGKAVLFDSVSGQALKLSNDVE